MKRNKQYTINLTEKEAEIVEALAKQQRRKPREMLYLLVSDYLEHQKTENAPAEYYDADGVFNIILK